VSSFEDGNPDRRATPKIPRPWASTSLVVLEGSCLPVAENAAGLDVRRALVGDDARLGGDPELAIQITFEDGTVLRFYVCDNYNDQPGFDAIDVEEP
jgi:hypothetical protein